MSIVSHAFFFGTREDSIPCCVASQLAAVQPSTRLKSGRGVLKPGLSNIKALGAVSVHTLMKCGRRVVIRAIRTDARLNRADHESCHATYYIAGSM